MNDRFLYVGDAIRENRSGFSFQSASPRQRHLRPSPRIVLGPVPREFGEWHYGDREAPGVGLYRLEDVILQSDRVLLQDGRTVCIEQNGIHPASIAEVDVSRCAELVTHHDEVVLLCGPAYQMYGHWLVDFLPRLHVLTHLGLDLGRQVFLLPHNIMPFARAWLSLLGIAAGQIRTYDTVTESCVIGRALIPTAFRGNGRANTLLREAAAAFGARITGGGTGPATRRLFISRRQWGNKSRTLLNAEAVERRIGTAGFEIVYPEELPIAEQVRLFGEAKILLGEYGSGLHNSIFSPPGTTVIAFRGTEGHPGFLQSGLCEALDQDVGYVFCGTQGHPQRFAAAEQDVELLLLLLAEDIG